MSLKKKQIRQKFNEVCLERDKHTCVVCGASGIELDVHHIIDRSLMPNGGYVKENGISLCNECHIKAEQFHISGGTSWTHQMHPDDLYKLIGSDKEKATKASEKL